MQPMLQGQYDWRLVALSIAIAICASYTALDLAGRTTDAKGRNKTLWHSGGAISMGLGIWAMHYIGMLAYRLPVAVAYSVPIVALSLLAAMLSSAVALSVVSGKTLGKLRLAGGSLVMGAGIATMHYSGMAAMELAAHPVYHPGVVALSIAIAVAVSFVALYLAFRLRDADKNSAWGRPVSAVVMGLAIAGMHYTGMAAVCFHHAGPAAIRPNAVSVTSLGITGISALTFSILALTLIGSLADRSFSLQARLLQSRQERWELAIRANQDGLFDTNLVTGAVFQSPRYGAMLGYGPDELPLSAGAWESLIHPEDKQSVKDNLAAYLHRRQGAYDMEYRLRHRDGTWRWILARGYAVWDKNGCATRIVGSHSDVTERKRSLTELKASEARFGAFMQHLPACAFIKDADGRMLYTSPMIERTWNLRSGEWIGKLTHEIWPAHVADAHRKHDLLVLSSQTPSETVETVQTPEGPRRFLTNMFSFPGADGQRALGAIAVDITERVHNEERLRASERRYRELFEYNPVPSWIYGVHDLLILDVNQAAIDHYGWSRQEFVGLSVASICLSPEASSLEVGQDKPETHETPSESRRKQTVRHRRNKKSDIWVELSSREIDAGGSPARLVMANDVTARFDADNEIRGTHAQMEVLVAQRTAELQTSEAKWRSLVDSLPQFVWSTGPDGSCDYLSNQWVEYTGVPLSKHLGVGWLDAVHPDDRLRISDCWLAAFKLSEPYDAEYRVRAKDGSYRWFVTRGRPVRPAGQELVAHWLGTSTDIDDQKRSAERLEAAVAERTVALAEARNRAELAARAKSDFLAIMSHEIRTPINGVIGMTHLMLETTLTSDQQHYLGAIRSSGQALLNIINDILDFSKIEAGKLELENTEFDLRTVVEEAIELVTPAARKNGLCISLDLSQDLPRSLIGDSGRLRQILLNLLSNAVKFTEHGSVSVSVAAQGLAGQAAVLHFTVRDSGIGLSPEQQAGLFQPFSQADSSTTRRFGGTGLGLSIVKRLVDLMGGTISVSSQIGEGTTFSFTIGLAVAPPPLSQARTSRTPLGGALLAGPPLGGAPLAGISTIRNLFKDRQARILVADDVITNQQVARGILRQLGLRADVAANGAEVLAALDAIPYDLILMDVRMPVMDGLEATRRIRTRPETRHLPIIAITASAMQENRKECLDAGMDDFVSKPISPASLAQVLAKWLPPEPIAAETTFSVPPRSVPLCSVFDMAALLDRLTGDTEFTEEILDEFLKDMPKQILSLTKFAEAGILTEAAAQAHNIRGASATVSGNAMSDVARQIESAGNAGDLASVQARIPDLHEQFARLADAIAAQRPYFQTTGKIETLPLSRLPSS